MTLIKTISIEGVDYDVEYYEEGENEQTFTHPYSPAYREIYTIMLNGVDITGIISFINPNFSKLIEEKL